jgi:hypothetical protein
MRAFICGVEKNSRGVIEKFRVVDLDDQKVKTTVSYAQIETALKTGAIPIDNAEYINGRIKCTNGDFNKFPKLNGSENKISVLRQLSSGGSIVGYDVCSGDGSVVRQPLSKVVAYAKKYGIANGMVSSIDGVETVIPISGEFESLSNRKGNKGSVYSNAAGSFTAGGGNTGIKKDVKYQVDQTVSENDIFRSLDPKQKALIQSYYLWYTMEVYREITGDGHLDVNEEKVRKLVNVKSGMVWKFAGVTDMGWVGIGHCSLGHALRYEYKMRPDEPGYEDIELIFGETCFADFLKISVEDAKKLFKVREIMSEEIELILYAMNNNKVPWLNERVKVLRQVYKRLGADNLKVLVGDQLGNYMRLFDEYGIPWVKSMALWSERAIQSRRVIWRLYFPEWKIGDIVETPHEEMKKFNGMLENLIRFELNERIAGMYSYDPFNKFCKRPEVGKYNEKTRENYSRYLDRMTNNVPLGIFRYTYSDDDKEKWLAKWYDKTVDCKELGKAIPGRFLEHTDGLEHIDNYVEAANKILELEKEFRSRHKVWLERAKQKLGDEGAREFGTVDEIIRRWMYEGHEKSVANMVYRQLSHPGHFGYLAFNVAEILRVGTEDVIKEMEEKLSSCYDSVEKAMKERKEREEKRAADLRAMIKAREKEVAAEAARQKAEEEAAEAARVKAKEAESKSAGDAEGKNYSDMSDKELIDELIDRHVNKKEIDTTTWRFKKIQWLFTPKFLNKEIKLAEYQRGYIISLLGDGESEKANNSKELFDRDVVNEYNKRMKDVDPKDFDEDLVSAYNLSQAIVKTFNKTKFLSSKQRYRLQKTVSMYNEYLKSREEK